MQRRVTFIEYRHSMTNPQLGDVQVNRNIYDQEQLSKVRSKAIRNMILDIFAFSVILAISISRKGSVANCQYPIFQWLIIYACTHLFSAIKNIIVLIQTCTLLEKAKKPKDCLELAYCCTFLNFQVAWLIYGNTLQYSSQGMMCKDLNNDSRSLWILMMVCLSYGDLLFILFTLICCIGSCIICVLLAFR